MWLLDKERVMYMFKVLNLKIHDKGARPTFFEDVSQGRAVWVDNAKLQPTKLCLICVSFGRSPDANACTFLSRHLVLFWYQEVSQCRFLLTRHLCGLYNLMMLLDVFKNLN